MKLLHTILSHWKPEEVDLLLDYHHKLDPSVDLLLAYGGPENHFTRISWEHKVFINDPGLRGPTDQQNYCYWLREATAWAKNHKVIPAAVFFTETDHPMLKEGYGKELLRILELSGCGFLGKWCSNREGTNSYFYLRHRDDQVLRNALRKASGSDDSPIYEALATGMLFSWEVLERVQAESIDIPVFTEVIIPSMVRALGYRLGSFDLHSEFMSSVRYRPNVTLEEALTTKASGAWCCHPFKAQHSLATLASKAPRQQRD